MRRIGLISDTHGLLRPQAEAFLAGCDHIVHAGDIGGAAILERLSRLAPVSAVRGNNDTDAWGRSLPDTLRLTLGPLRLFLLHDLNDLRPADLSPGVDLVVCGHSHRPHDAMRPDGLWVVNPGSAGPRRFRLPVSVGELLLRGDGAPLCRLVELEV